MYKLRCILTFFNYYNALYFEFIYGRLFSILNLPLHINFDNYS